MFVRAEQVPVEGKQLTGQPGRIVAIGWNFPTYVVVEYQALGGLMDMRLVQVHTVTLDRVGDAADEDHGAVRFQSFNDSHMGQGIVQPAISVEIPRVIEKHEIAGTDIRPLMESAVPAHVVVDEPDAVPLRIIERPTIQIDAVFQEDSTGDPRTVVGDTFTLA